MASDITLYMAEGLLRLTEYSCGSYCTGEVGGRSGWDCALLRRWGQPRGMVWWGGSPRHRPPPTTPLHHHPITRSLAASRPSPSHHLTPTKSADWRVALTERLRGIDPPGEVEASRPLRVLPLENTQSHALTCTKATGECGWTRFPIRVRVRTRSRIRIRSLNDSRARARARARARSRT